MTRRLVILPSIIGSLAGWAVRLHADNSPSGIYEIVSVIRKRARTEFGLGGELPMHYFETKQQLRNWLKAQLLATNLDLVISKNWKMDLDAFLTNVSMQVWQEAALESDTTTSGQASVTGIPLDQTVGLTHVWFANGDHPLDECTVLANDKGVPFLGEGKIVRRFRNPGVRGTTPCAACGNVYHLHGWLDFGHEGELVCPGRAIGLDRDLKCYRVVLDTPQNDVTSEVARVKPRNSSLDLDDAFVVNDASDTFIACLTKGLIRPKVDGGLTSTFNNNSAEMEKTITVPVKSSYRHNKRGGTYQVLSMQAVAQASSRAIQDNDQVTVYVSDKGMYVRLTDEFMDGRFTQL